MRPLHLKISAFGPYADHQIFDFQLLGERNLFLVTGDIGAGKTTVFDAICCALYGETSGGERTVEDMRSHHALAETRTEITLDFSIQGALYRAWFSPKQQIPKKRGEGFTEQTVQSAIYQIDFAEQAVEEATLICESIRNTKPEVEALIGFNVNQFRQVVMLAQGKFRELLTANSADREEILKTLVDTEFLSRFERKLKTLEIELKQKVTDLESQIKGLLKSENVDSVDSLLPQQLEVKQLCAETDKDINLAEAIRLKAETELNQAIAVNRLFEQQKQLLAAKKNLEKQKGIIDALALSLKAHANAEKLWPDYRLFEEAEKAWALLNTALTEAEEYQQKCNQLALKTAHELDSLETGKQTQEQNKLELHALKQTSEALSALAVNKKNQQQAISLLNRSEQQVLLSEKNAQENQQRFESNETAINDLSACGTALIETQHQLAQKKDQLKQLKRIEDTVKNQHQTEIFVNDLLEQLTRQQLTCQSAEDSLLQLEHARLQDMASHLAKQLETGKACTVCGSHDHPIPATPPPHIPSNQQIDEAKQQLKTEKEKLLTLQQQSEKQQHKLAGIVSVLAELTYSLSAEEMNTDACTKEIYDLSQQLKSISLLVNKKQALQQDQIQLKQSLKVIDAELTDFRSQLNEHRSQVSSLEGQIQNQLKTIPKQYQDEPNLNQQISLLDQDIVRFDQQFKAVSQANQSAQQLLNTAIGRLNSTKAQQQQSTDDFNDKKNIINRAIEQSCFADLAELKSARLPEQEFLSQTEQWQSHQKDTLKVETQLNELAPQLANKTQLDSVSLENQYRQAQAKKNELLKQKGQLDQRFTVLDNLIKKVAAETDNLKTVTEKYQQTSHLSKIANGSGYQGSKLSFSRFLLGRLLDEILQVASGRLAIMSEGRYQLTRKLDQSNKQSAFGLDIELVDAYTGQKRPVNTFSGGEGFLASLSLALGLSEVVQNNAGGIHLDTLFIDEGFGSLNDEALEQAINVLTALSGNGRLVAVISHVSELKERIDAQLVVRKTSKGSSAEFVV